jgi:type IV pilus assembly protein PilA
MLRSTALRPDRSESTQTNTHGAETRGASTVNRIKAKIQRGFTLIELMIVVAIIGILAAIAIPNFIRYQLKSKTAEVKTVLGGIKTSEEAFRAEFDQYPASALAIGNTGLLPTKTQWVVLACPGNCSRQAVGNCTTFDCIGYKPSGLVYYEYQQPNSLGASQGVPAEFSVQAAADLDADGQQGQFNYCSANSSGATVCKGQAGTGAFCGNNWSNSTLAEVFDCAPGTF